MALGLGNRAPSLIPAANKIGRGTLVKLHNHGATKIAFAGLALLGLLCLVPAVYADSAFHTVQLPVARTAAGLSAGFPELKLGHVMDIHANGPTIYSIEQYTLSGSKPNTDYQVANVVWFAGCPSANPDISTADLTLPTMVITSNANGFAHGTILGSPEGVPHGITVGVLWTFTAGDTAAYASPCVNVALD